MSQGHYWRPDNEASTSYTCINCKTQVSRSVVEQRLTDKIPCVKDNPPVISKSDPRVKRYLKWKGKRYEEGHCTFCGKQAPMISETTKIGSKMVNGASFTAFLFSPGPKYCFRCLNRFSEEFAKLASQLQSAQSGGEWEDKKLEIDPKVASYVKAYSK